MGVRAAPAQERNSALGAVGLRIHAWLLRKPTREAIADPRHDPRPLQSSAVPWLRERSRVPLAWEGALWLLASSSCGTARLSC